MPLVKPHARSALEDLFWGECRRSDFLVLEKSVKKEDLYRVTLVHNGYIVAIANSVKERDDIWARCSRIVDLVCTRAGEYLCSLWR